MFSYNDGSPTLMTEGRATVTSGVGGRRHGTISDRYSHQLITTPSHPAISHPGTNDIQIHLINMLHL